MRVILLGMVYEANAPPFKQGQEWRDHVRLNHMADNGFEIRTIDNKHNNSAFHLMADFSSERRLRLDIQLHWAGLEVEMIILDYFFMPV